MAEAREPTLLHSCARAATAAEARFRIDHPITSTRSARIVAVDAGASEVVGRLAEAGWDPARFLDFVEASPAGEPNRPSADATLRGRDGSTRRLVEELAGADAVVMVATRGEAADAASVVGDACIAHGVMTAGIVVAPEADVDPAVAALRPNAMVLVVLEDEDDVAEMLTALRV